jgi:hypothetical protein
MKHALMNLPATIYYADNTDMFGNVSFFLWHNDTLVDVFMNKDDVIAAAYEESMI